MSLDEFERLMDGELLENNKEHNRKWSKSIGFCFLRKGHFLENAILDQFFRKETTLVKVEFKVDSTKYLKRSKGRYETDELFGWDPEEDDIWDPFQCFIWMREYCTTQYSLKTFKVMRAELLQKKHWFECFDSMTIFKA
jgi:hypothetical protein